MAIQPIQAPIAQPQHVPTSVSSKPCSGYSNACSLVSANEKGTCSFLFDFVMFIPNMFITLVRKTINFVSCGYVCADRLADPNEVKKALEEVVNGKTPEARQNGFKEVIKNFEAAYNELLSDLAEYNAKETYEDKEQQAEYMKEQLATFAKKAAEGDPKLAEALVGRMKEAASKEDSKS